jgi:hypothetical protein
MYIDRESEIFIFLQQKISYEIKQPYQNRYLNVIKSENQKFTQYEGLVNIINTVLEAVSEYKTKSMFEFLKVFTNESQKIVRDYFNKPFFLNVVFTEQFSDPVLNNITMYGHGNGASIHIGFKTEDRKWRLGLIEWITWLHELGHLLCKAYLFSKQIDIFKIMAEITNENHVEKLKECSLEEEEDIADEIAVLFISYILSKINLKNENKFYKTTQRLFNKKNQSISRDKIVALHFPHIFLFDRHIRFMKILHDHPNIDDKPLL